MNTAEESIIVLSNPLYAKLAKKYKVNPTSQTKGIRECNNCHSPYLVKFADLKRGWGMNCNKSCSAISNDNGSRRATYNY